MNTKTIYKCDKCGNEVGKWTGKCSECNKWNSFVEKEIIKHPGLSKTPRKISKANKKPQKIIEQNTESFKVKTGITEFDRVIGDGIAHGSLTLLSGEPGIGKSTLILQIAEKFSKTSSTLIISGEESEQQIISRAKRLNIHNENIEILNENNLETIIETLELNKPGFAIIDSIQVVSSMDIPGVAGSINQVRYCTEKIMEFGKTTNTPIFLIGHVTKDGSLAGPKVLEHLVDTVLQLEGDRFQNFRILRAVKNRFGSCSETGIFEMKQEGLIAIKNPSELFLQGRKENAIGSAITVLMEGTRPLLIEVQALVSTTHFGYPKRTANGFDLNRLQILIAILEKFGKMSLMNQDIFLNVVGGIKLSEPASDMAVILAIASSYFKIPLKKDTIAFGEAGLSGEIRNVNHYETRLKEAKKMGYNTLLSPPEFNEISAILNKTFK